MRRQTQVLKKAKDLGWTVVRSTGKNHVKLRHTSGGIAFIPSTPSDVRGEMNTLKMLRRLGNV